MGVASAVISFNDGTKRLIDVMKELKVEPGHYSETYCNYKDFSHVKSMENKILLKLKVGESVYGLLGKVLLMQMKREKV